MKWPPSLIIAVKWPPSSLNYYNYVVKYNKYNEYRSSCATRIGSGSTKTQFMIVKNYFNIFFLTFRRYLSLPSAHVIMTHSLTHSLNQSINTYWLTQSTVARSLNQYLLKKGPHQRWPPTVLLVVSRSVPCLEREEPPSKSVSLCCCRHCLKDSISGNISDHITACMNLLL